MGKSLPQMAYELDVRPKFYYPSDGITVCLLLKDNEIKSRGISVCSFLDQFRKETGRNKSMGRAIKALVNKENSEEIALPCIEQPEWHRLENAADISLCKSVYMPEPTRFEYELVRRK